MKDIISKVHTDTSPIMDDEYETEYDNDAASCIQVAISRQQSRLLSPRTPLLDKVEALQKSQGLFDQAEDLYIPVSESSFSQPAGKPAQDIEVRGEQHNDALIDGSKPATRDTLQRSGEARSLLRDGFTSRQRASSGPERVFESFQKAILSIPKKFSIATEQSVHQSSHGTSAGPPSDRLPPPSPHLGQPKQPPTHSDRLSPISPYREQAAQSPTSPLYRSRSGRSTLRRSYSDDSLAVSRTFSQASSLGDDTRFEHVQNQVNSRLKAIRDTWQDKNIRLPSLSTLKPELFRSDDKSESIKLPSLASLRPDFLRSHASNRAVDPVTRQPFHSVEALQDDIKRSGHAHLDQALSSLDGDVIVLGGYRGSVLRSAKPPHKQLWVPIKVGLNLRKVDLEVGIEDEDDHKTADDVIADGMLKHIGPVDISARLLRRLRSCANAQSGKLRVHDYGYDWRLDPTLLSRQLCQFIESLGTRVTVIAHSLGGLITRHAVNQRPELFRGIVYAGVPTRCVNILGPLRNGDDVLLSSRVLTAQVNFTIRTSFALLPLDGRCFIDKQTREEYRVDFFDPNVWREHRLSPCISRPLPPTRLDGGISSYVSTVAKALPLPNRRSFPTRPKSLTTSAGIAEPGTSQMRGTTDHKLTIDTSRTDPIEPTVSTAVTIPPDEAYRYLSRTLANVKRFKQELAYRSDLAQSYPPIAVIYGKNTPTVIGARVVSRDAIKQADAYDDLAFASGDGVVLARAAMPPKGYIIARGGLISSERGHVSLLADLDAVGRALIAVTATYPSS